MRDLSLVSGSKLRHLSRFFWNVSVETMVADFTHFTNGLKLQLWLSHCLKCPRQVGSGLKFSKQKAQI